MVRTDHFLMVFWRCYRIIEIISRINLKANCCVMLIYEYNLDASLMVTA